MTIEAANNTYTESSHFFDHKISRPSNRSEFKESFRALNHYAGKGLRQEDVERLLLNTPGFITTFNEIVRSVKDSSESGAFSELQGKKIISQVLDDAVSFITTSENLERILRKRSWDLMQTAVKERIFHHTDNQKSEISRTKSEDQQLKDKIQRLTFGQHLSDTELNVLITTPHINSCIESINRKIETMSVKLPREICEWSAAEAIAHSVREALSDEEREVKILNRFDKNISYHLTAREQDRNNLKNDTDSSRSSIHLLSQEFTEMFHTNALDFVAEQSKLLNLSEQNSLLTTIKGIFNSLKNDSSLTLKEKISVACRASRATEKEVGFKTISATEYLTIFVRNIANEKSILLSPPPKALTQEEINEIRRNSRFQGYLVAAAPPKVTVIRNTSISEYDKEKSLLAEAPQYRGAVERMLAIGTSVLSDPMSFEANRSQLIRTFNDVSRFPQSMFSGNIQGMALGLSSHFMNGGGFGSVEKVQLRAIVDGLSNIYDSENRKLRFEVVTEKNHARKTARNLLERINKTLIDPERLSHRDGALGALRRANMQRDISTLLAYFDKDYNKSGIAHSIEAAELRQLQSLLVSETKISSAENLITLQHVQRFLSKFN